jgi:flagellar hook-associated protein 2
LSKINAALSAQGLALTAGTDGSGRIKLTSNNYGSSQTITVVSSGNGSAGTSGFGSAPTVGSGTDIAGTIGGNAAIGNGLNLTGASGRPEEGLSLTIAQTVVGSYGSVTVASATQGVEGAGILTNLQSLVDGIADPLSGPLHYSTDSLNQNIKVLNDQISAYQERLDVQRELYTAQFNKADEALRLLTVAQTSLSSQLSKL